MRDGQTSFDTVCVGEGDLAHAQSQELMITGDRIGEALGQPSFAVARWRDGGSGRYGRAGLFSSVILDTVRTAG